MTEEKNTSCCKQGKRGNSSAGVSSAVYGLGFIGAVIYFIQHASTFTDGAIGFLKALVWPGILVYKLLEFLKI